ncbi:MAG: hypothetical protein Hals2KO_06000 [Halioglobus sp.]
MSDSSPQKYIPALKYHALTNFYDTIVRLTTREKVFKTELVNLAAPHPGEYLLDVGCGTGTLIQLFAEHEPNIRIMGLDADPVQLKQAQMKVATFGDQISFQQGYAQNLPPDTPTFDLAVSSLFFHHLTTDQKRDSLGEIYRVLKPGGRLLVADWGKPSSTRQRLAFFVVQLLDGFETTRDSVEGLLPILMRKAGFIHIDDSRLVPTFLGTVRLFQAEKPQE